MKPKEIQELLDFIASSGLAEVNLETENFKLSVKRNSDLPTTVLQSLPQVLPQQQVAAPVQQQVQQQATSQENTAEASNNGKKTVIIKAPMIGTFYKASNPESPVFCKVGDKIKKGQTICIIEAMKLFNEIESEYDGTVVKILLDNASPVEFDQPLFEIELN